MFKFPASHAGIIDAILLNARERCLNEPDAGTKRFSGISAAVNDRFTSDLKIS
jgi:hypothetical protein